MLDKNVQKAGQAISVRLYCEVPDSPALLVPRDFWYLAAGG